jgi:hypothetical protein
MLENFNTNTELKFKELSPEEKQSRGILGRLYGPIASTVQSTRNGRKYTESLWEKVFDNPLTKEMFAQGGVPGELDHPVDREETCSEKIAIMMPEAPTKDKDGHLIGYFDIIDTPCGRIAYALAKYGFNLGISSRGSGDTFEDIDGNELVDEDTYSFNAFDLVLLPACKDARLQLAESLDKKKIRFNEAMQKELENATEGDKKIMTEALENLKLYEDTSSETQEEEKEPIETNNTNEAGNAGAAALASLQEALKDNQDLQKQVLELQEKLSVSYTKEIKLVEENTTLKGAVKKLTESVGTAKALGAQMKTLRAQLDDQLRKNASQDKILESYKLKLSQVGAEKKSLNEGVSQRDTEITSLRRKIGTLNESVKTLNRDHSIKMESLSKEIAELKKDSEIKNKQYSQKLQKSNGLVESYRKLAKRAVDKYIECKATNLGINTIEIKNKLKENYSFDDIDQVCENLRSYKRNISRLPFNIGDASINRVALKEDTSVKKIANPDDVVDQDLFNLLNS